MAQEAPQQMVMGQSEVDELFAPCDALLVKQTARGCIQECLGCEAKSEFKISPFQWQQLTDGYKVAPEAMQTTDIMYALEKSSCCLRLCWRDGRPFSMEVSAGGEPGGSRIASFNKPCGCPLVCSVPVGDSGNVDCPCCCLLPKVTSLWGSGESAGSESQYLCHTKPCIPRMQYSEDGSPVYILQPQTCCGGCCIACSCSSGKGLTYIPFYFHNPETMEVVGGDYDGPTTPQIRKVWTGLKKECCTTADNFVLFFPEGSSTKRKLGLLGLTFLLDFSVFERQKDGAA